MLPASIMCQTVTIIRDVPGGEDPLGNPTPGTQERTHLTQCCSLQPLQGTASVEAALSSSDSIVTRWTFYGPPGIDLKASDRVQQAKDRVSPVESDADAHFDLAVDGDPDEWILTGTALDHSEAYLKRWSGGH